MKADLLAYRALLDKRMPGSHVRPDTQCRRLLARRVPHHIRWILEAKDDPDELERRGAYPIERRDALDCLLWSTTTLRALRFL